ncbi:MAG: hypothetical protein OEL76_06785 [Siculibacillus sp.]|nr:hypothetical protein [Siculibacillus sp.]
MRTKTISISLAALALAGCSTTPLPEDFSGKATYDIVRKIRCEARDAVRSKAVALMLANTKLTKTYATGKALQEGRRSFSELKYSDLDPETIESVKVYEGTTIGYQFDFDIKETNDNSSKLNLTGPIGVNVFSMELSAGGKLSRQNKRTFAAADKFRDLAMNMGERYCQGLADGANAVYPITGDIGIMEIVDTFINLNQSGGLTSLKDKNFKEMTDTRTFNTDMSFGLTPKLEISSKGSRVKDTSFTSSNVRNDQHQVAIALALPVEAAAPSPGPKKKATKKTSSDATTQRVFEMLDEQNVREGYYILRDLKTKVDQR